MRFFCVWCVYVCKRVCGISDGAKVNQFYSESSTTYCKYITWLYTVHTDMLFISITTWAVLCFLLITLYWLLCFAYKHIYTQRNTRGMRRQIKWAMTTQHLPIWPLCRPHVRPSVAKAALCGHYSTRKLRSCWPAATDEIFSLAHTASTHFPHCKNKREKIYIA